MLALVTVVVVVVAAAAVAMFLWVGGVVGVGDVGICDCSLCCNCEGGAVMPPVVGVKVVWRVGGGWWLWSWLC